MLYREATLDDAEVIAALHADSWSRFYRGAFADDFLDGPVKEDRLATWQSRLAEPKANQYVLLAEGDGQIVGVACSYGADDARWGTLLDNLHVKASRQGEGIGEQLVRETARWALRSYPDSGLYLGVLEQNVKAQGFYRRLGAKDVGGFTYSPPGGGETAVRRYAWDSARLKGLAEDD